MQASEKNKQLMAENTQLKRQAQLRPKTEGATGPIATPVAMKTVKPPPSIDLRLLLIVALISLVIGFQLANVL